MTTFDGADRRRVAVGGARPDRLSLAITLLCIGIVIAPFASGLRGLAPAAGRSVMAILDLGLLSAFLGLAILKPKVYPTVILGLIVYSFLQMALVPTHPGLEAALLGLRKSMLMVMAYAVGTYVPPSHRRVVHASIIFALLCVCAYAVKQYFFMSSFDMALLREQSANIYTNMIDGKVRAFSLLSSGFHVGMAANVLAAYAFFMRGVRFGSRVIMIIVAVLGCYSSLTRTFMFLLFAQFSVAAWLYWRRQRLIVLLGVVSGLLSSEALGFTSIGGAVVELLGDRRLLGRQRSYDDLARFFSDSSWGALFGFGPGSAGSGMRSNFALTGHPFIEPHNIFAKYLFELGIPLGALLIGSVICSVVLSLRPAGADRRLLIALALIFVASGQLITSVETWPISIYAGLAMGLYGSAAFRAERS